MTSFASRHRSVPVIASALVTAAVFTGALWIQRARSAWPFGPPEAKTETDHPVVSDSPAATPDRVPVEAVGAGALDIRLETIGRESLTQIVTAVATVVPDESRISHVHTRVAGWIEQLDVSTTGEIVRAGQPLARIFSQELLSSQAEYLAARRNTAALGISSAVITSGRARLRVLGMTEPEIDAVEQSGEPARLVTVVAPRTGVVVNRGVTLGTSVDPSTTLFTIADLSRVWVFAEVPEASIPAVRRGTIARLDFPASGRPSFPARIDFIYPTLTERTRTLRVRLSAPNPGGALRPGLFGTATFESTGEAVITVPRDAVVDTGRQQHVFVAVGESFEPREVTLGVRLADRVEVREGLRPGESIVVSGVFLLDSESRLRATSAGPGHAHGDSPARPGAGSSSASSPADPHGLHRRK